MQPTLPLLALSLLLGARDAAAQRFDARRKGLPRKSAHVVDYTMRVRLDPAARTLAGTQQIHYRNETGGATTELRFHLYLNAFRNLRSSHLRESDDEARERYRDAGEFGYVRLTKLDLVRGAGGPKDLLASLEYVAPDDGNGDDRTVARVVLPAPFPPGGEIVLATEFEAKLPKAYRRTGWGPGDFFMVAQWFPKLGVLEDAGGGAAAWNCHQFHAWTEFYADYGTYDVTIETPQGWPVGATGKQVGEPKVEGGVAARRFVQEDVHDFAWVTDPDYLVHDYRFDGKAGLQPEMQRILGAAGWSDRDLALSDVDVRILLHPEHDTELQLARHEKAVEVALSYFGSRYGRYPYRTLTVVDPCTDVDWHGLGGGMEYPTLITCGTPLYLHSREMRPEGVTVHEFGHQFWYGLSGNNEFEESWLDEGMNSYSEGRAQDLGYASMLSDPAVGDPVVVTRFGPFPMRGQEVATLGGVGKGLWAELTKLERLRPRLLEPLLAPILSRSVLEERLDFRGTLLPDLPVVRYLRTLPFLTLEKDVPYRNLYNDRDRYLRGPDADPVVKLAWTYLDHRSYRVNSYPRPASILCTLERMMGPERWWPCLRRFHERARFAHPTTEDFLATVREFGGEQVAAFAREAFYTTKTLDYGIDSVTAIHEPKHFGNFDPGETDRGSKGEVVVTVRRYGQIRVPVKVRFEFEKAGVLDEEWGLDGQGEWRRFRFPKETIARNGKLLRVWVDPPDPGREVGYGPCGVYVLDSNLLNNSWQHVADRTPARRRGLRLLIWAETVLGFFGGMG